MIRRAIWFSGLAAVIAAVWIIGPASPVRGTNGLLLPPAPGILSPVDEDEEEAGGYREHMNKIRANQVTGVVDINDVIAARAEALAMRGSGNSRGALSLEWEELGPDNIGGRTRAILIDRNNTNRMYTGGVSGGLWISDNAGNSWRVYSGNDTLSGVGIGSLTQAANGDIYVGTGEYILNSN